ncbi:putative receptor protein kinase TMK1 [Morus notabilis]|uniref:Putative receptor protein kinase TMK1 n=2 Tax=Morus notabilis TaxID=981085 RepID=W9SE31_9ROSA|nr:putative receptor protein kinase TMK1 [Morus notabilis]
MEDGESKKLRICLVLCLFFITSYSTTDPNDVKVLNDFREGLENSELLKWPENGDDDPCGPPSWPHVFCSGDRVSQVQVQNLGLKGTLPQSFNQLSKLSNLGLQGNKFYGELPSFRGLSDLEFAYLDNNELDTIPSDFFSGLSNVRVLALDRNPFNATTGWSIPEDLAESFQLTNLSLVECNVVGPVPEFLGALPSLAVLKLSYNRLTGEIPSSLRESLVQILWLNDQDGEGMSGSIDVITSMTVLTQVWLHGNKFTGKIPDNVGQLLSLKELNLNGNNLVGPVPQSLVNMELERLDLSNNFLVGPIPEFKAGNATYASNYFCQSDPGLQCAPEVTALLDFLHDVNYPLKLVSEWSGNDPCDGPWMGLSCNLKSKVSVINLPGRGLNGTLSPSLAKLDSLFEIRLSGNNINGTIPDNFTQLENLRLLDLTGNNLEPPLPRFHDSVKIIIDENPFFVANKTTPPAVPSESPDFPSPISPSPSKHTSEHAPRSHGATSPSTNSDGSSPAEVESQPKQSNRTKQVTIVAGICSASVVALFMTFVFVFFCMKKKAALEAPSSIVIHPRDPSDPDNMVKIAVSNNSTGSLFTRTASSSISSTATDSRQIEAGNLVISVQVLRKATKDFAPENELGRGGFGTVYKGELEDGTEIAVKRMEGGVISSKALDEFEAEIAVLSKVRHRHLVSLLGYTIEGNERLLIYDYLPQGALSRHLFHWKSLNLKPLSWTNRLIIALDVARGMEYLHSLARQTFIHRDLKSSNILLGDDFRAKVSDFGLVKLAPDGVNSVATKLAGTFGYLAPEYAVMGKITTKADVFSFGVVLMELLTGLMALDEGRSEESRYLANWFWQIKSSKQRLMAAVDSTLDADEESISTIAELAGHCTAREPHHRPDMGHVVNVLVLLVEKWKPVDDELDSISGIDYRLPLPQLLKAWQETDSTGASFSSNINDSKGSIPARPMGFAELLTSTDAR